MWQVDNDRYTLWRLEQQLLPDRIDRLIGSVSVADRPEPLPALPIARRAGAAIRRLAQALYPPLPHTPMVRRASK
jgi:hypothetical protein